MSAVGQKLKYRRFQVISALPHKADIKCRHCDVRFAPIPEVAHSEVRSASNPFKRKSDPEPRAAVELIFRPLLPVVHFHDGSRDEQPHKVMGSVDLHQPSRAENSTVSRAWRVSREVTNGPYSSGLDVPRNT